MASLHIQKYRANAGPDPTKATFILLHGGALSHRMYKDVIPLLTARGHEVYAPDLPGHGKSVQAGPFTFKTATNLLYEVVKDIKGGGQGQRLILVGVSLGGQVVLDFLQSYPDAIDAAIVSSTFIHPPDKRSQFNLPRMPTDQAWLDLMTEDVKVLGVENANGLQKESFAFQFHPPQRLPPVLVVAGEEDISMCIRDFPELSQMLCATNPKSRDLMLKHAWHNHPIDIPGRFADVIHRWAKDAFD